MATKIIEKVKKLLALAARAGTPEEAASAASLAQEIMLRHKLEQSDIAVYDAAGERVEEPIESISLADMKRLDPWMGAVAGGVAAALDCEFYWWRKGGAVSMQVVGRASDIQACKYVFEYLRREIEQQSEAGWKSVERLPENMNTHVAGWKNSFRLGAGRVVKERLLQHKADQRANLERAALSGASASSAVRALRGRTDATTGEECVALTISGSDALAVIERDRVALAAFMKKNVGKLTPTRSSARLQSDAHAMGKAAGAAMNLGLGRAGRAIGA